MSIENVAKLAHKTFFDNLDGHSTSADYDADERARWERIVSKILCEYTRESINIEHMAKELFIEKELILQHTSVRDSVRWPSETVKVAYAESLANVLSKYTTMPVCDCPKSDDLLRKIKLLTKYDVDVKLEDGEWTVTVPPSCKNYTGDTILEAASEALKASRLEIQEIVNSLQKLLKESEP